MPEVKIENLNAFYKQKSGTFHIINDLNVVFPSGKISVIIGSSGCGKTTLLKSIIGLIDYEGKIFLDDIDANTLTIQEKNISYVSQNLSIFPNLTVFNNIAAPLKSMRISGDEIRQRVFDAAEMLKITPCLTRKPKQISLGQCQRTAIARALIKRPNLYIFDEPFSSLDNETSFEIIQDMKEIFSKFDATVIFISHDVREALMLADEIFVMENGQIIAHDTPEQIVYCSHPDVEKYFKDL